MPQISYEEALKLPTFYAIAWDEDSKRHMMFFDDKETSSNVGYGFQKAGKHMQIPCIGCQHGKCNKSCTGYIRH